jgi:hypothetical protein
MSDWPPPSDPAAIRTVTRDIFADYFQLSLEDDRAAPIPDDALSEFGKTLQAKLIYARPGIVVVGTVRNMTVGVSLQIQSMSRGSISRRGIMSPKPLRLSDLRPSPS